MRCLIFTVLLCGRDMNRTKPQIELVHLLFFLPFRLVSSVRRTVLTLVLGLYAHLNVI